MTTKNHIVNGSVVIDDSPSADEIYILPNGQIFNVPSGGDPGTPGTGEIYIVNGQLYHDPTPATARAVVLPNGQIYLNPQDETAGAIGGTVYGAQLIYQNLLAGGRL